MTCIFCKAELSRISAKNTIATGTCQPCWELYHRLEIMDTKVAAKIIANYPGKGLFKAIVAEILERI